MNLYSTNNNPNSGLHQGTEWNSGKYCKTIIDRKERIREKTILLSSGWFRPFNVERKIPCILKLIETIYQDPSIGYNKNYKYYG